MFYFIIYKRLFLICMFVFPVDEHIIEAVQGEGEVEGQHRR